MKKIKIKINTLYLSIVISILLYLFGYWMTFSTNAYEYYMRGDHTAVGALFATGFFWIVATVLLLSNFIEIDFVYKKPFKLR